MKNTPARTKLISGLLAAALTLMSPGFPAYQALAAEAAPGAAGLPAASFVPMLRSLSQAQAAGANAAVVAGVEMAPLLQALSSVDMDSAQGRAQVQPVASALAQLPPGATREQAAAAIAGAVAGVRAKASGDLSKSETSSLLEAARYPLLLDAARRQSLTQELYRRKETAAWVILAGADSWINGDGGGALGAAGRDAVTPGAYSGVAASGLREYTPEERAKADRIERLRRKATLVAGLGAATGVIALIHGVSLLTIAVSLGSMVSIVAHEAAHLKMARLQGDDTAAKRGVKSAWGLIDPVGTLALPAFTAALAGALFGVPLVFGWAKPVPIDFNRPGNVKRSAGLIAAAGPLANFALAAGLGLLSLAHPAVLLTQLAKVNVLLGLFNLMPAGPQFDGFKVLTSLLPKKLYERLTRNERVAPAYRSAFQKLYEGPSALLNAVGMDGQGRVNRVTRLWTLGAFALFALASHAWLGGPVLLLALVCSYDYYCIREKIQNEAAVKSLTDILQGFSSELAKAAEEDETIQSTINTEEVEHALKNALEDILDKVIDSEGFDSLSEDQKWERFKSAYTDAAVAALHQKGMSADSEETIRDFLHKNGSRFFEQLKGWAKAYDVFTKWHSPKRKNDSKDELSQRGEKLKSAGKALALLGAALLGAHFGLPHAAALGLGLAGIADSSSYWRPGPTTDPKPVAAAQPQAAQPAQPAPVAKPESIKPPTFQEALEDPNLKLNLDSQTFLLRMLSEMKLEEKAPIIGRIDEMSEVYKNVTAPRGGINSVVLIGKAGVGKTAIPEKLAQALALAELQPDGTFALNKMKGRYLMKLNLSRLLSMDDPPKALDALIGLIENFNDANKRSGNKIVLFIDEIHQIFLHPKGDLMANILKEPLRDGRIAIVAATTEAEYKKYMENDEAFRRRMVPIPVKESSVAETLRMLQGTRSYYEGLYQVMIHPDALKTAAELSKYDQELFLPGRAFHPLAEALKDADYDGRRDRLALAIADGMNELQYVLGRLTDELKTTDRVTEKIKGDEPTTIELYNAAVALSQRLVELYRQRGAIPTEGTPTVTADMVKEQIAKKTGVKSGMLTLGREPMERYLDMENIIGARVIGQPDALHAIAEAVLRNKAGLSDPKRPLGVFYLTGPTGSGKTHLAKELARFLFDDPDAVIRLDMSEYMESHSPAKMIGAPPGYVGYGEGGQLTEKVRKKPYSVVLFDELEKANPDVWLIMLQILGDGRLTDGQGRTVDFKNTIILMTSNLGMYALNDMLDPYVNAFAELQARLDAARASGNAGQAADIERQQRELAGKLATETKEKTLEVTKEAFKKTYPPEFEGRLSAPPIVFNRITPEMAQDIVKLNLKELASVMDYAGHELAPASPDVVKFLVEKGFDVRLGARPLQNAIDRYISQPVARKLLEAARANGDAPKPSRVALSLKNGAIAIDVSPLPPKAVAKTDAGQGAAQEVFSQALNLAVHAASDKVAPQATLEVIDAWVRAALQAYPSESGAAEKPDAVQARPAEAERANESERASAPPRAASTLFIEGPAPSLGPMAVHRSAAHYEIERKDADVRAFTNDLEAALTSAGYPEPDKQALARTVEDQANPGLGFVKLLVEQAKKMTPSDRKAVNVGLAFDVTDAAARVVIHRNGPLGDRERTLLKTHFAGVVPEGANAARDKAEAINVMGKDGRRLFFDLYRRLSALPGAKLGVATGEAAQGGAGTDYWVELPKTAAPVPAAEPAPSQAAEPPPSQAEPPQPPASQASQPAQDTTSDADDLIRLATTSPILIRPTTRTLNVEAAEVHDPAIRRDIGIGMTQTGGYSGTAKVGAMNFLTSVGGFLRDRAVMIADTNPITLSWEATPNQTTIVFSVSGRAFTEPEIAALRELFRARPDAARRLQESGAQVFVGSGDNSLTGSGASIWIVFPGARSDQADGFAAAAPQAGQPASDAAAAGSVLALAARPPQPRGLHDGTRRLLEGASTSVEREIGMLMSGHGFSFDKREVTRDAARLLMGFMTDRARAMGQTATAFWDFQHDRQRLLIACEGGAFQAADLAALREMFAPGTPLARDLAAAGARVLIGQGPTAKDGRGIAVWLEVPRRGALPVSPSASPRASAGRPAPRSAPEPSASHAERAREAMLRFARAVIAQGDDRGPTVRYAAADLEGALSTPQDLAGARELLREASSGNFAAMAAAGAIVAKQGSRADDEPLLRQAIDRLDFPGDLYKPLKQRLAEDLAKLLVTDNPARREAMKSELQRREPADSTTGAIAQALYLALARCGGPELEEVLMRRWMDDRTEALVDFLKRNDPELLRRMYERWQGTRAAPQDRRERVLTLWAVAEHGDATDLERFNHIVDSKWDRDLANYEAIPVTAEAYGRFLARLGLFEGENRRQLQGWLTTELAYSGSDTWHKSIAAVEAVGAAGGPEDLPELEQLMRYDPARVDFTNEITQAAAAMAWAKLVNRTGLIDRYLTEPEPAAEGQPAQPRIVQMLSHQHGIYNKAALEAVRLYFTQPRAAMTAPAAPRPSALRGQAEHPRFTSGPAASPQASVRRFSGADEQASADADLGPWLLRLPGARLSAVRAWAEAMRQALAPLLGGAALNRDILLYPLQDEARAPMILAWNVFQDLAPAVSPAAAGRAKEFVLLLLHLMGDAPEVREAKLSRLEREVPLARRAYEAAAAVAAIPGARFGIDYDERRGFGAGQSPFELWLALDHRAFSPAAAH